MVENHHTARFHPLAARVGMAVAMAALTIPMLEAQPVDHAHDFAVQLRAGVRAAVQYPADAADRYAGLSGDVADSRACIWLGSGHSRFRGAILISI